MGLLSAKSAGGTLLARPVVIKAGGIAATVTVAAARMWSSGGLLAFYGTFVAVPP